VAPVLAVQVPHVTTRRIAVMLSQVMIAVVNVVKVIPTTVLIRTRNLALTMAIAQAVQHRAPAPTLAHLAALLLLVVNVVAVRDLIPHVAHQMVINGN
jgi:hypothetical protein